MKPLSLGTSRKSGSLSSKSLGRIGPYLIAEEGEGGGEVPLSTPEEHFKVQSRPPRLHRNSAEMSLSALRPSVLQSVCLSVCLSVGRKSEVKS